MKKFQTLIGIVAIALLFFVSTYFVSNQIDGERLYKEQGCYSCHMFKGQGGSAGPDLTNITKIRSDRWIRQKIKSPSKDNPNTRMPAYGHLSRKEINALIRYLKT